MNSDIARGHGDNRGNRGEGSENQPSSSDFAAGKPHKGLSRKERVNDQALTFDGCHEQYKELIQHMPEGSKSSYENQFQSLKDEFESHENEAAKHTFPFKTRIGHDKREKSENTRDTALSTFSQMIADMKGHRPGYESPEERISKLGHYEQHAIRQIQDALKNYRGKDAKVLRKFFNEEINGYSENPDAPKLEALKQFASEKLPKRIEEYFDEEPNSAGEQEE